MTSQAVISWRWGLSDPQVELLREFRTGSGRTLTFAYSKSEWKVRRT